MGKQNLTFQAVKPETVNESSHLVKYARMVLMCEIFIKNNKDIWEREGECMCVHAWGLLKGQRVAYGHEKYHKKRKN